MVNSDFVNLSFFIYLFIYSKTPGFAERAVAAAS
jgi:hypothetical protein